MNFCFVSREFKGSKRAGGIATYVYLTAKLLVSKGHNVHVITARESFNQKKNAKLDGINIVRLSKVDYYWHSNKYIRYALTKMRTLLFYNSYRKNIIRTLLQIHKDTPIDLVEFSEFGNEGKYINRLKNKIPSVVRLHGPSYHNRSTNELSLNKTHLINELDTVFDFTAISYCSNAIKMLLKKYDRYNCKILSFEGVQCVIHNFFEFVDLKFKTFSHENFIFFAGTLAIDKGVVELVEACKEINSEGKSINLILAGKLGDLGANYQYISQKDSEYNSWLEVLGPIDRNELFSYYKQSCLNVFPSHWDNMPLTCIESMGVGGLVLGSKNGGMSEIITDSIDGFLVEPKSVQKLKHKILEILELDEVTKSKIKSKATMKIQTNFSSEYFYQNLISFYDKVIVNETTIPNDN